MVRSRKSAPEPEARPAVDAAAATDAKRVSKKRGTSPWLVILLLVVMVGAAAAYYFLVYKKDDTGQTTSKERPTDRTTKKPPVGLDVKKKPEPVPLPSATLVAGDPKKEDVLTMKAGPIIWSGDDGAAVAAGEAIAKIAGFNAEEAKIRSAAHDQKRYEKRIADWTKAKEIAQNDATIKRLEKDIQTETDKIAERQATIDAAQAIIDAHNIKAPSAGTLEMLVSKNERVIEGQTVAAIVGEPGTIAEFTAAKGKTYGVDQSAKVAKKAPGSVSVVCMVELFDAGKVTVACPAGSGLAVGDEVVLE